MYKMYIKTMFLTLFCAFLSITNAHSVKKPTTNSNTTTQTQELSLPERMANMEGRMHQRIIALIDEARSYTPDSITRTISLQELRPITPAENSQEIRPINPEINFAD